MIHWLSSAALASSPDIPEVDGVWALELEIVTQGRVPILGDVRSVSRTWIWLSVEHDGTGFFQEHRVCGAEVRAPVGKMRIPSSYLAAVAPKRYPVALTRTGDGWRYDADTLDFRIGFDPRCARVPTEPSDPCVSDPDSDGNPGVTIEATAPLFPWVEVYLAQHTHPVLHGQLVAQDRIEGTIEMRAMSSRVLGASNRLFASSPDSRLLPDQSRFVMLRLPPTAGCAEVRSQFGARALSEGD